MHNRSNLTNGLELLHSAVYSGMQKFGNPLRNYLNNFNKIRVIIQNACYFVFSTVLSKIFYIKYVYI